METVDTGKITSWLDQAQSMLIALGFKVLGAIMAVLLGRWLIRQALRLLAAGMVRQKFDATVQRYLLSCIQVGLNTLLALVILGVFGIETTSLAALAAGAGVAIGAAWSGLLGNFAAGFFLLVMRPYKVGDYVLVGGVEGVVLELGLFGTTINTPDYVKTIVGNGKIMAGDIRNYSANPYRRVDLAVQLASSVDPHQAIVLLRDAVAKVHNLSPLTPVHVEILEFNEYGPKLVVRPYCNSEHFWQVYFDTNLVIADTLRRAGFPVATHPVRVYPA